ncbi:MULTISPECIES: MerR family transcriptional regulator [unclassified Streptomyces]|uniref:MerR family transcriptional regulator n=1 Tax=unclassified Streptomyces TaxID=2593676 RepID=UPI0035E1CBA3
MDEPLLDIAEVAARTGVAPSALRFYERLGLLEPAGRNGLRRTYGPDALDRVALILNARATGFTLDELGDLLQEEPGAVRERLREKTRELGLRIEALERARDRLGHALTCRHPSPLDCPTLLAGLRELLPGDPARS